MDVPKCSIIIPTYNHADFIERSVSSSLAQTYPNVEVIVVDDGSTDNTSERLRKFGDSIIYHKKMNGGLGAARNTGIDISEGKYLQFLDADDFLEKEKLEFQVPVLEANDTIALVYSDFGMIDSRGNVYSVASHPLRDEENPLPVLLRRIITSLNACLIRRESVIDSGMFDEDRCAQEDWEFLLRLCLKGYRFKYCSGNLVWGDDRGSTMRTDSGLMFRRTEDFLHKCMTNPDFLRLGRSYIADFIAFQNLALAENAYNYGWWGRSRRHFMKAIGANPRRVEAKYWACIPKTIVHQVVDVLRGKRSSSETSG